MDKPAILITPLCETVEYEAIYDLSSALFGAKPGQVIHAAFPVKIHHLIDGLWIESGDLPDVLEKSSQSHVEESCAREELCAD